MGVGVGVITITSYHHIMKTLAVLLAPQLGTITHININSRLTGGWKTITKHISWQEEAKTTQRNNTTYTTTRALIKTSYMTNPQLEAGWWETTSSKFLPATHSKRQKHTMQRTNGIIHYTGIYYSLQSDHPSLSNREWTTGLLLHQGGRHGKMYLQ